MHLVELLDALRATADTAFRRVDLPEVPASRRALMQLGASEAAPRTPPGPILEALRQRLITAYQPGGKQADWRDLRDAPWVLWDAGAGISRVPGLLQDIYSLAEHHPRTLRNLIEAWMRHFSPDAAGIKEAGERIEALLSLHLDMRLDLWRTAHSQVSLFEPRKGPARVATWLLDGPDAVDEVLRKTGLADPLRGTGGYAKSVQGSLVAQVPERFADWRAQSCADRGMAFLTVNGNLRFPEMRGPMAYGLLAAWLATRPPSDDAVRRSVLEFLLKHLGDPRLRPANWVGVGDQVVALVRRWLTRASLDAFFDLISDHAHDAHWRWRKAFWQACMEYCNRNNIPFDAWLALGPRVHASARAVRELGGAYAKLEKFSVQPDHAVMLMTVGPLVLCDWSHNGKLRAWMADSKWAPKMYRMSYSRNELVEPCLPFPYRPGYGSPQVSTSTDGLVHASSERGHWQRRAAELLARRAGVKMTEREWLPR